MPEYYNRTNTKIREAVFFDKTLASKEEAEKFLDKWGVLNVQFYPGGEEGFSVIFKGKRFDTNYYIVWDEETLNVEFIPQLTFGEQYIKITDANKKYLI